MSMIGKAEAILSLLPNSEVTVDINNNVTWISPSTPALTDKQINAEINRLEAEYNAKQYQRDRAKEYPDFKEYLDGIVKGDQAQIDKYIADCLAVKAKYPK